jgi:hypothetical protein
MLRPGRDAPSASPDVHVNGSSTLSKPLPDAITHEVIVDTGLDCLCH